MQNKRMSLLKALTASAADILNPPAASGGVGCGASPTIYVLLYHIHVVNTSGSPATFSLYKGATAGSTAGTEFGGKATSVAANSYADLYFDGHRFDTADFLSGLASAGSNTLILTAEFEIGVGG